MDKQIIADKLEKSILDRVCGLLALLPNTLSYENIGLFITVCERIEKITSDAFTEADVLECRDYFSGWRRLLTPWWKNGYTKWEYAYGNGFTWSDFINYIVECGCVCVTVHSDYTEPTVFFSNDGVEKFCISLIKED